MPLREVPLVDVSSYLKAGDAKSKTAVASAIGHAFTEIGFAMIVGHGVDPRVIEQARSDAGRFFSLSFDAKMKYERPPRGYKALGSTAFSYTLGMKTPPDIREAYSVGPPNLPDTEYYRKGKAHFAPNVWPEEVPQMQASVTKYFTVMQGLGGKMIRLCALGLGLPEQFFDDKFDRPGASMVVNHYPKQTEKPVEGQVRGGEHTDYGAITLLQRDNSPGGLQVRTKEDEWVNVPFVKDSFVVNIGDLMARWTNDRWVSTLHRVVNPPWEVASKTDRMSIAFFFDPNYDTVIEPLKTCVSPGNPAKYEPILAGEHKLMKLQKVRVAKASQ
jgi:isopenicillin N synthase-like dioxygenase